MKKSFEQHISSVEPKTLSRITLAFGLMGLIFAVSVIRRDPSVPPSGVTAEHSFDLFLERYGRFAGWFQFVFSVSLVLAGGGLFCRTKWGRDALRVVLKFYLASTLVLMPIVLYLQHLLLRKLFREGAVGHYVVLSLFACAAVVVLVVLFRVLLRVDRELNSPRFVEWTSAARS
jgi:hypothetical protein